ncbi:MAG: tripartite tricarboxylate transporter substrate-binding protein [Alphaproteobacteria bacterium]|nr:tripartite tricarboxylate transporter substrate-binding protein [Alphaproteobacteria bacterium]
MTLRTLTAVLSALVIALAASGARSADFYAGKTITLIIPAGEGGGYDGYARLAARHLGKHLPGKPRAIAVNKPGASGTVAANYMYSVAKPDGLTISGMYRQMPFAPLFGNKRATYDATKYGWIGTSSSFKNDASFLFVHKRLGASDVDQLKARNKPLQFGSGGRTSTGDEGARIIGPVVGLDIKIVRGYKGSAQTLLAVEKGEVDAMILGISSLSSRKPAWLKPDGPIHLILQFGYGGEGRHPKFPNVPRVDELASTEADKALVFLLQAPFKIARPFAAPPGLPADRLAALRTAFMAMSADPAYLGEAKRLKLDISPRPGHEVAKVIDDVYKLPPAMVKRYIDALKKGG